LNLLPTNQIVERLRKMRIVSESFPLSCSQSIAIPGFADEDPILCFLFYIATGEAGKPKSIHPPLGRVIVDKQTGLIRQIEFAPWIWHGDHDESSVIGHYPGHAIRNCSLLEVDQKYNTYGELTDQLIASASDGRLDSSPTWNDWQEEFLALIEEGLIDYCDVPGFPSRSMVVLQDEHDRRVERALGPEPVSCQTSVNTIPRRDRSAPTNANSIDLKVAVPRLLKLADEVRQMLRDADQPDFMLESWRSTRRLLETTGFSVAVVGEFSRGKSTLINRLIEDELLPVGDLPTTACLTRIASGDSRTMTLVSADGRRNSLPLPDNEPLDLGRLSASETNRVVQLSIVNDWLESTGIQLFDTPGADDMMAENAILVSEAIANCDATLIAVSALSPLSLTEQNFVEEHVFQKQVPRVALVITRLDQLPAEQRAELVNYITDKASKWAPQTEVWLAHCPDAIGSTSSAVAGPDAIRRALTQWGKSPQRFAQRLRQMVGQLTQLSRATVDNLRTQQAILQLEQDKRDHARADLKKEIISRQLDWESAATSLQRLSLETEQKIERAIQDRLSDLANRLSSNLSRATRPNDWWTFDLPHRLNQELRAVASNLNQQVNEKLKQDFQAVLDQMKAANQVASNQSLDSVQLIAPKNLHFVAGDVSRFQTIGRVATGVAAIAGFALFGPVGGGVSVLGGLMTDRIIKSKTEDQRFELTKLLTDAMTRMASEATEHSRGCIRDAYSAIEKQIVDQVKAGTQSQLAAIQAESSSPTQLAKQVEKAEQLVAQLENFWEPNS